MEMLIVESVLRTSNRESILGENYKFNAFSDIEYYDNKKESDHY